MIIFLPLDQFGSKQRIESTLSFEIIPETEYNYLPSFDVASKESCHVNYMLASIFYTEKLDYHCLLTENKKKF